MKVVVYARTSGDESETEQNVAAQVDQVRGRAEREGHQVVASFWDDGVSGASPAAERDGWQKAVRKAREHNAAVVVREISRFSRRHPAHGLAEFSALDVQVISLAEPHFTTVGAIKDHEDPALVLLRFVSLWQAWSELLGIRQKTRQAMHEIITGKRPTKSGRPAGRPVQEIDPEHLAEVREVYVKDGLTAAHRKLLELRGYGTVVDATAKKNRHIGKETLARALGLRGKGGA